MKVIVEGEKKRCWWIGQRMRCRDCGRTVELEAEDGMSALWLPPLNNNEVRISCVTCSSVMVLKRYLCKVVEGDE